MRGLHAYETPDGQVYLRRSGSTKRPLRCQILRTKALVTELDIDDFEVMIALITNTIEPMKFRTWFDDWIPQDDMANPSDASTTITGRWIDVAVVKEDFDKLIETGRPINPYRIESRAREDYASRQAVQPPDDSAYFAPIAAVRINGEWVEPFHPLNA